MQINKRKSLIISALFIFALILTALFLFFSFTHPTLHLTKTSGFSQKDLKKQSNKLRFVVPDTIDTTKTTYISIKKEWFESFGLGKITEIKAKPGKYLALDFTDRQYDSEVFTIYTKNWFGIKKQHDVIVDYSNYLRVFFPESYDGAAPRKPIILPYSKLETDYRAKLEELQRYDSFFAYDKKGLVASTAIRSEEVFNKQNAQGRAFIVNNNTRISLVYDFVLPGIFKNQTQKTQVYEQVEKAVGKTKTYDPAKQGLEIKFNTPPFYITKFLGWYYTDPAGNRVDLLPGQEFQIPTWVKSELRLIAKYEMTTDTSKLGPALDKQGLVSVSYFDGPERVFFDIVRKGTLLKERVYAKLGYAYQGWYTDPELTNKVDFNKNTADTHTVLYLKSIKKPETPAQTHTVNFITKTNANQLLPLSVRHGEKLDINYSLPSTVSYLDEHGNLWELDYWNLVDPITGTKTRFDFNTLITEDITLEAVLKKRLIPNSKYNIKRYFESLEHTGEFIEDASKQEEVIGQVPDQEVELLAHQYKAPEGFNLTSDTKTKKTINKDGSTVFELRYTRIRYKVNFEVNYNNHFAGANASSELTQTIPYQGKVRRPQLAPSLTKPGHTYTFKHWQLKDEMGNVYKGVNAFDFENAQIIKNTTLVAYFKEEVQTAKYTIKHIYKGLVQSQDFVELESKNGQVGSSVTVSEANRISKPGFEIKPQSETKTIQANGQTTFTLTYERKTFLVEYNYNSGIVNGETQTSETYKFEEVLRDIEHPTKTDPAHLKTYTFAGWQDEATGQIIDFSQNIKVDKNLKLKAIWQEATATRPVYLKMIWEKIDELTDQEFEQEISTPRTIGATAQIMDADIQAALNQFIANNPHPNHESNFDVARSVSSVTITTSNDKHYITVYFKARTYTVNFDYDGLVNSSVADVLKSAITLKYTQKLSAEIVDKMKAVSKPGTTDKDYVFDKLINKTTGEEFDPTIAYNKNLELKPIFKEKDVLVEITPKVSDIDEDKVENPTWPKQTVKVGTKFDFQPTTNIKSGWRFLGWAKTPSGIVEEITVTRTTREVYAVFAPGDTTYKIKHIFEGIEDISEREEVITKHAKTNDSVTVSESDKLNGYDHGFEVKTAAQTQTIKPDGSTTFTLKYTRREFDVTFNVNFKNQLEGTASQNPATQKVKYEGKAKMPNTTPSITKHGRTYEFIHWQTEVSMNGTYSEQQAYDFLSKVTNNFTLVAYFKETIQTVRYKVVHKLEKQGKYSSLDGKYDEVPEIISNQKVEDGATYRDYYALDSNLYEKDTTHPDNVLYAQLTAGDNTTEVRQYYKLKEISVEFKKTEGIKNFKTADTIKVKKTRRITLPEYELKDNYKFIGWSLSETGAVESEFIAGDGNMQIFAKTEIQEREITYTIRTQKVDGSYAENTITKSGKIGTNHIVEYTNYDNTIYQNPQYSKQDLTVSANQADNQVTITIDRKTYTVTYQVDGHSLKIPDKTFRHGQTHGEIDESNFQADELTIVKLELDGNQKSKEEIKNLIVTNNHTIKVYVGEPTRLVGKYPQTKVTNTAGIVEDKQDERQLHFTSKGNNYSIDFTRHYYKDNLGNKYEKFNGQYYKFEDVEFVKIPKKNTWFTKRIIDFSPFNFHYNDYADNAKPEKSIFNAMVGEIGRMIGETTYMPTYDDGDFSVKPALGPTNNNFKIRRQPTDYASAVLGNYVGWEKQYRGTNLTTLGEGISWEPYYQNSHNSNWWLGSQYISQNSKPRARAIFASYLFFNNVNYVYGIVVCIR